MIIDTGSSNKTVIYEYGRENKKNNLPKTYSKSGIIGRFIKWGDILTPVLRINLVLTIDGYITDISDDPEKIKPGISGSVKAAAPDRLYGEYGNSRDIERYGIFFTPIRGMPAIGKPVWRVTGADKNRRGKRDRTGSEEKSAGNKITLSKEYLEQFYKIYGKLMQPLVEKKAIRKVSRISTAVRTELTEKIIGIFEEVYKKIYIKESYFDEEEYYFDYFRKLSPEEFIDKFGILYRYLTEIYGNEKEDERSRRLTERIKFYANELEKNSGKYTDKKNAGPRRAMKERIMEGWAVCIWNKKYNRFMEELSGELQKLIEEFNKKSEQFLKLYYVLNPIIGMYGKLWDLSDGFWETVDFSLLEYYAEMAEKIKDIEKLVEMLGRAATALRESEETLLKKKFIYKPKIKYEGRSEIVGVHESDDISYMLPQEMIYLGDPEIESIFYKKFLEKKLLCYRFIDKTEEKTEKHEKERRKKKMKGPVIVCVDTSGSMAGPPERIAKVIALAAAKIAGRTGRSFYLISFSTGIRTFKIPDENSSGLEGLIRFLLNSFHGGTDIAPALTEAVKMLESEEFENADVLVISDFIMDNIPEELRGKIGRTKDRGTKYHSIILSAGPNTSVLGFFDHNWIYGAIDGYKNLKRILTNVHEILLDFSVENN